MRDQEYGARLLSQLVDPGVTLDPEFGVTGGQRLVDQQDLVVLGGRDREPQPRAHARRVRFHRQVDGVADAGEVDDALVFGVDLFLGHAHGQAAEHDVALAGQVVQQGRVHPEQRGVADGVDGAMLGRKQASDRAQQSGLA